MALCRVKLVKHSEYEQRYSVDIVVPFIFLGKTSKSYLKSFMVHYLILACLLKLCSLWFFIYLILDSISTV